MWVVAVKKQRKPRPTRYQIRQVILNAQREEKPVTVRDVPYNDARVAWGLCRIYDIALKKIAEDKT